MSPSRERSTIPSSWAPLVAAMLLLSGCGAEDRAPAADAPAADAPAVSEVPADEFEASDQGYELEEEVVPRPGMLDVEPVRIWLEYGGGDQEGAMRVVFASQGPPCQVLDRTEAVEAEGRVTITLFHGRDPELDADEPCDGPLRAYSVEVPLEGEYGGDDLVVNGGSLTNEPADPDGG